ncbi:MAG: Pup-like protein [Actinomycetota bacterium]
MVLAMAERTKKQRPSSPREEKPSEVETSEQHNADNTDRLKAELDDLLDDMTNAEDFVKSYVQKGGQ